MKILVMNGPNINFLGIREKGIYGEQNYEVLVSMIEKKAEELGVDVEVFQSNHEGAIIDKIQEAYYNDVDGIVINPGAFTHYSYAVRDALASVAAIPKNETSHDKRSKEKIEDAIIKMIIENQDINKPTGLGEVGSRLVSLYPDFDVRSYGYNMLSKFLEEFTRIQMVKHGNIVSVTLREDQDLKENIDSYVVQIVKKAGKAGVELSTLGNKMYEKYKDFKIRDYGYSQFNQYVKSLKHVRVEQEGTILKAVYKG